MAYIKLKNPTAFIIQKQVIRVEKLVGQRNKFKDIAFKQKVKLLERNRREEVEKKYEDRKDSREKLVSNKFTTPRLGFLDSVKNFLFSVLFGALTLKLLPHLPKLKGLLITTLKIGNFGIEFAGTILNAMATFVNEAYKLVDFGKQQAKLLGGDTGVANYEKMLSLANKVINSMLIAGMIFSDLVESDASSSAGQQAVDLVKDRVVQQAGQRAAQQAAINGATQIGARAAAGVVAGVGLISSALGEGAFQLRKFTTKIESDAYKGLEDAKKDPNPFTRFVKTAFYNAVAIPGMRFYNFLLNGVGTLLDIVGAPFRYAIELLNYGVMFLTGNSAGIKEQRENLGKFDARIREQLREIVNTLSFGMIAKQKGSFGSLFGNEAVRAMGYASGGAITRGGETVGGVIGRTEVKRAIARTIEIPMSPLSPGAEVGGDASYFSPSGKSNGKTNIETFFPNPESPGYVNPYSYLSNSYTIASSGAFLKPFLQMPIKLIMGNGPSEGDYNSLASAVNNLFNYILANTMIPGKKMSLADEIGSIDILRWARNSIKESMLDPVNSLLESLKEQFKLRSGYGGGKANPSAQKGDGAGTNPLAQFGGEAQFVIGDSIAHGFAGRSGSGSETSDTQVGRSAANVLKILQSKGNSLKGMLIDLSTGIANSVGDFTSVEAQLSYLKSIGARVRVLGVGNEFSKTKGGINEKLAQLVSKYGFYFYGGYPGAKDKVHGTDEDYKNLKLKREKDTAAATLGATSSLIPAGGLKGLTDADWNELAYIVSGEAGPGDDVYGVAANVLTRVASPAWPNTIREVGRQAGQYEAVYKGLARYDAKLAKQLKDNQGKIASALKVLNGRTDFKGQSELGNRGAGDPMFDPKGNFYHYSSQRGKNDPPPKNPDQSWKKWIAAAFHGGYINKTQLVLTHPGEYVIDADSVKLFGINLYDIVNQVETTSQRKNAAESLISILSQYTEDGFPETEDDYTYQVPSLTQIITAPPQVIPIRSSGGGFGGSSDEDPSQDFVELR